MHDHLEYDQAGLDLTIASEGMRLKAYPDPGTGGAPWTIGVGHTGDDVYPGRVITQDEGYQLLRDDIAGAVCAVKRMVKVPLTQGQFNALVDFTFNCGEGALESSTLLRMLNAWDYRAAAAQFDRWNKAGGRVLPGLVRRRDAEEAMFLEGMA